MDNRQDPTPVEPVDLPPLTDRAERRKEARTAEVAPLINEHQLRQALSQPPAPPSAVSSNVGARIFIAFLVGFALGYISSLIP